MTPLHHYSAILPIWPGGYKSIIDSAFSVSIPKGTSINIGLAASQGGIYIGGTQQIYIHDAAITKGIKIIETFPIEEAYLCNLKVKK